MRMAGNSSKPSFFWQGVLILLPVLLLALGSIASLRWDERSAERDARQKAAENVQSLAELINLSVGYEFERFIDLQNMWTKELFSESRPSFTATTDPRLSADIVKWEQDYPGFKLAESATREAQVLPDGRQIDPPDVPVAPLPPKWFRELSQQQQMLWEAFRQKLDDNKDYSAAQKAFEDSGAPDNALQAAANLEQALKYRNFRYGTPLVPADYSESGISFRGIALARMLQNPQIQLSNSVQQAFWSEVIQTPSFIAPMLLDMAEARTNRADAVTCEKLRRIQQLREIQSKEREWLTRLRDAPELKDKWQPPAFWASWTSGSAGEALALGHPVTFQNIGAYLEGLPFSGKGQGVWFVPRPVLEAIFIRALAKDKHLVPNFAEAVIAVEGKTLIGASQGSPGNERAVLGTATGTFGNYNMPEAAQFELKFLLTSRGEMLSAERHRARLFGLLILASVAAALVGFVSARRAFRTQLQLSDAKSNFVSSVSHELRAPIASVRLMAESLERGKVQESQKQNQYFQFIVQECRRLSSLIENVLDFSRIEQGRKQYEFEPTDLAALIHETVKLMEPYAAEKGVILETHSTPENAQPGSAGVPPASNQENPDARKSYILNRKSLDPQPSPVELELDGRALQQALVNLIDNAIKHAPKGSAVKVGFEWNGECARLWVEDNGPGIPPEEHEKIFERFYRLGSELRRETQGVGIGLSIVKHIVEAHGGHVTVRSNPGHGSRFTIELPTTKPQMNSDERR